MASNAAVLNAAVLNAIDTGGNWIGERVEDIVLLSRYLLVPLFLALLFRILTIIVDFSQVLVWRLSEGTLNEHTLIAVQLVDITMIANFIWLISAGSYYVFIDKKESTKKRPRCLVHISSGVLKEKMAGSLIGISSVHLLQVFLHMPSPGEVLEWSKLAAMIFIHAFFIVGLLAFCHTNSALHHQHDVESPREK